MYGGYGDYQSAGYADEFAASVGHPFVDHVVSSPNLIAPTHVFAGNLQFTDPLYYGRGGDYYGRGGDDYDSRLGDHGYRYTHGGFRNDHIFP